MDNHELRKGAVSLCVVLAVLLAGLGMSNLDTHKYIEDNETALADAPMIVTIQGIEFDLLQDTIDLNNRKNVNYDLLIEELSQLSNIKTVEICNTNLSYEQIDTLMEMFPNVKFIFTITLANTWTIRTDVVAFSTNKAHHNPAIKNNEVWKLKYLKDIVALDLGHNEISDLSFLEYMPNLKILILADNWISDLSPVASCKQLMYLETFCNPIRDITPLAELDSLVDLNVCYNYFTDYTPLLNKPKLERLHVAHTSLNMQSLQSLVEAYPDATVEYMCGTSVQGGWRNHPRYFAMREMFLTNTVNSLFSDGENVSGN